VRATLGHASIPGGTIDACPRKHSSKSDLEEKGYRVGVALQRKKGQGIRERELQFIRGAVHRNQLTGSVTCHWTLNNCIGLAVHH
jgi:hypothetical protein